METTHIPNCQVAFLHLGSANINYNESVKNALTAAGIPYRIQSLRFGYQLMVNPPNEKAALEIIAALPRV
jgi:hypothetical protein